ncbi:hypothetical protein C1646_774366 [Rhizophagus diaphanus]|nr:hypothetical protein C1646_774366 [Rhizophagus diaphanus] [Rhizophagus sp. MUCL 43196]
MFSCPRNTLVNAFPVHIVGNSLVSDLKEAIKSKNLQTFANVDAKNIQLWKYWSDKPPKKHIHVLVEPPVPNYCFERGIGIKGETHFVAGITQQTPVFENDGAVLNMLNDSEKFSHLDLREMLQVFLSKSNFKFTVLIETPSKPFNEWTFPKVYTKNEKYKEALRKLLMNWHGNLDYGIESRMTGRIIGLVKVKKDDFKQGFVQATVQLESSLGCKCKANEMDDGHGFDKVDRDGETNESSDDSEPKIWSTVKFAVYRKVTNKKENYAERKKNLFHNWKTDKRQTRKQAELQLKESFPKDMMVLKEPLQKVFDALNIWDDNICILDESQLFYWEWPCQGEYDGYIHARPLTHFGEWNNFLPSHKRTLVMQDRMIDQSMHDELLKHVEAGEFEEEDIPKVNTIQNWINTYARVFKERANERDLANECEKILSLSE